MTDKKNFQRVPSAFPKTGNKSLFNMVRIGSDKINSLIKTIPYDLETKRSDEAHFQRNNKIYFSKPKLQRQQSAVQLKRTSKMASTQNHIRKSSVRISKNLASTNAKAII